MRRFLSAFGFLAIACAPAMAAPECPVEIPTRQELATALPGWRVDRSEIPHRLHRIGFYDGRPEERAALAPDGNRKAKGRETSTWRFGDGHGRSAWMECGYDGTTITLARELPPGTRACTVTYDARVRLGGMPRIEGVACR